MALEVLLTFPIMASDAVLVDTSRSANFARRAFTAAVFCSLPVAAAILQEWQPRRI